MAYWVVADGDHYSVKRVLAILAIASHILEIAEVVEALEVVSFPGLAVVLSEQTGKCVVGRQRCPACKYLFDSNVSVTISLSHLCKYISEGVD
jgi:hypothetical protein